MNLQNNTENVMKHVSGVTKHVKTIAMQQIAKGIELESGYSSLAAAPGFFVQKQTKYSSKEGYNIVDNITVEGEVYYILQDID